MTSEPGVHRHESSKKAAPAPLPESSSKQAVPAHWNDEGRMALVRGILARIGDKWSVTIICSLGQRPRRFNELRRDVAGITQRQLTSTLRALERDGIVSRTVLPSTPPAVEYALTDVGQDLERVVYTLAAWADDHADTIRTARVQYDSQADT
ncbi:helix-turn-helix domain-containing protein [Rhodococcus sp. ACPA1]|uniref:winged helix-turn-helix transcriptional regulator n=1 Tax=Rhodococcus sp. ACPA1 TaxID=2028572 RepID=UPI00211C7D2D|nr:helix-turn-helix domain-containing protein [Rhodococcus sp. ACPA1]